MGREDMMYDKAYPVVWPDGNPFHETGTAEAEFRGDRYVIVSFTPDHQGAANRSLLVPQGFVPSKRPQHHPSSLPPRSRRHP